MSYDPSIENRGQSYRSYVREEDGNTKNGWRSGQNSSKINIQDAFLNHCRREKITVNVRITDGHTVVGTIAGFDPAVIAMEKNGCQQLVFKNAVAVINPVEHVNYIFNEAYHHDNLRTHAEYTDDLA